jgi:hypothetical protein
METLIGRQYSFEYATHFALHSNVLDPPASYIHLSLTRDAVMVPFFEGGGFAQSHVPHT